MCKKWSTNILNSILLNLQVFLLQPHIFRFKRLFRARVELFWAFRCISNFSSDLYFF